MLALLSSIILLPTQPALLDQMKNGHEPVSVMVRYDDLDLSGDAGLRQLRLRLQRAANVACPLDAALNLRARAHASQCRERVRKESAHEFDRVMARLGQHSTKLSSR